MLQCFLDGVEWSGYDSILTWSVDDMPHLPTSRLQVDYKYTTSRTTKLIVCTLVGCSGRQLRNYRCRLKFEGIRKVLMYFTVLDSYLRVSE